MNELNLTFQFESTTVKSLIIEAEPWFIGVDVATALGYTNPRDALAKHVDPEDKGVAKCDTLGGTQDMTIINEPGLYSLIFSSQLESAKQFKRWVTHEVLPSIRKKGYFSLLPDNELVQLITERQKVNPATLDLIDKTKIKNQIKQEIRSDRQKETDALWIQFFGQHEAVDVPKELRRIWYGDMPMYHKFLDKYHADLNRQAKGQFIFS